MRAARGVLALAVFGAVLANAAPAAAADCDARAVTMVRYFLEDRDAREYRRAQRYLSEGFGQHFRDVYGAAYLDYMSDPDVTWRQSAIQASTIDAGRCAVTVTAVRDTASGSGGVSETYALVATYLGWRIDEWRWQPAP